MVESPKTHVHSKVGAGAVGGAVAVVAVWIASAFGVEPPAEVAVALGTILGFVFGYFAEDESG